eukprot:PhM_4_TR13130/c0_g1_i1/m.95980
MSQERQPDQQLGSRFLHVRNVDRFLTPSHVVEVFGTFATVAKATRLLTYAGYPKEEFLLEFDDEAAATRASHHLHDGEINGMTIACIHIDEGRATSLRSAAEHRSVDARTYTGTWTAAPPKTLRAEDYNREHARRSSSPARRGKRNRSESPRRQRRDSRSPIRKDRSPPRRDRSPPRRERSPPRRDRSPPRRERSPPRRD